MDGLVIFVMIQFGLGKVKIWEQVVDGDFFVGDDWNDFCINLNEDFYMTLIYRVFDQNKENQDSENVNMRFIMQLKEGTDFVISFSKE